MKKLFFFVLVFLVGAFQASYSTVGGPEEIDVLGFDPSSSAIYFSYNYYNEGDQLPDLLEYSTKNRSLTIWRVERSDEVNYSDAKDALENYFNRLKKTLKPLDPLKSNDVKVLIEPIGRGEKKAAKDYSVPFWDYRVRIIRDNKEANSKTFRVYHNKDGIKALNVFSTPDRLSSVAVIRYEGIWMETGYDMDHLLFAPKELKSAVKNFDIFNLYKNDAKMIGVWQDMPYVSSGYSGKYLFFSDAVFRYDYSQYDAGNHPKSFYGTWEASDTELVLSGPKGTVKSKFEIMPVNPNESPYVSMIINGKKYWKISASPKDPAFR